MESQIPYFTVVLSILFFTGFVKIATTLSICKNGMGLSSVSLGFAVLGVSLALSLVSVEPILSKNGGLEVLFNSKSISSSESTFRPFLESNAHPDVLAKFKNRLIENQKIVNVDTNEKSVSELSFPTLIAAFLISELKEAFKLGLMILLPFLLIDLIVTNILMVLSVTQISHHVISLPIKLLLFVAVDGWGLISQQLLKGYTL